MRDREPPFRPRVPVLDQRGYWFSNDGYDKPALATEPMRWGPGLHGEPTGRYNRDPDLRHDPPAPDGLRHLPRTPPDTPAAEWNELDVEQGGHSTTALPTRPSSTAGSTGRAGSTTSG